MKINLGLFVIAFLFMMSCGSGGNQENSKIEEVSMQQQRDQLYQDVIKVHDEVMPKMQEIIKFRGMLNVQIDSLNAIDSTLAEIQRLKELDNKLEMADKAMMNWMRGFKPDMNKPEVADDVAMNYLEGEMAKIQEVKAQMNGTIAEAEVMLNK